MTELAGSPAPVDIGAAFVAGTAGVMILSMQPLVFGPLVSAGRITNSQLGIVAAAEIGALGVLSVIGPGWLRRGRSRTKLAALALLLAVLDILSSRVTGVSALYVLRGLAGACEGALLAGAALIFLRTADPERWNAAFLTVSNIVTSMISYALPVFVTPRVGATGGFAILATAAFTGLLATPLVRIERQAATDGSILEFYRWPPAAFLVLAAILFQNLSIGAAFTFVERTAGLRGFSANTLGLAASLGLAAQVLGAGLVAWRAYRLPAVPVLAVGSLFQGMFVWLLGSAPSGGLFIGASIGMGFAWLTLFPFGIKLILAAERTRQAVFLVGAMQMAGLSLGPLIAASMVSGNNVLPAYGLGVTAAAVAGLLYATAFRALKPQQAAVPILE